MRVTCIQLSSGENYNKNFKDIIYYINLAIKKKSDFIITPEVSSIMTKNLRNLYQSSFKMKNDPLVNEIKIICKNNNKWIMLGSLPIKVGGKLRNRSILIGPKGKIEKYYDKINMFNVKISKKENHQESKVFKAGNKLVVAKTPWGKLGMTICYDLRFPELFRKLSKKKIHFITVPSAFTKITGKRHWIELLKARAIENFCFIFAPNQTGKNNLNRETYGHSAIISPDGKVLAIKKKGKGLVTVNIKPEESMKLRKIIPSLY